MLDVTHENYEVDILDPHYERCCICRKETPYCYIPLNIALCHICAQYAEIDDLPTKKEWIRREEIATKEDEID
jgi:hypothetical protein